MAKQSNNPKIVTKKHVARLERERRQVMIIRIIAIGLITFVVGLIGYGYLDLNYLQLKKSVAVVNGDKASVTQWQEYVQLQRINLANTLQQYQFYQQNFGMDTSQQQQQVLSSLKLPEVLGQQVVDQLIDDMLIRQEAKKLGITVSADEVEKSIQESYQFFPDGTLTPTVTPTTFMYPTLTSKQLTLYPSTATPTQVLTSTPEATATPDLSSTATATPTEALPTPTFVPEAATATATPYTLEGFKTEFNKVAENYKSDGISEATIRDVYELQLLRTKVMDAVTADLPHTEEQVWARHILVADEATATKVEDLLAQGEDFGKVAAEYSTDTGSKNSGGDLGWFGKGKMVAEFEAAAYTQEIGVIGPPVKSQFGYHIIQVLDRREVPLSTSDYQQKQQTAFSDWLAKARQDSTVTTSDVWKQHLPPMPPSIAQLVQSQ
jgi:parvulin-like peptidyl-prolyl isomerase